MEAIRRTWEKPQVFREDTPEFEGGSVDEFLSGEKDGPSARGCREEKGEGYPDVFIRQPHLKSRDAGLIVATA